jgi:hypothetical protein
MAEMDPVQIAQTGVDPVTGTPLSKEVRKALFRRATVSGSIFGRGGALVPQNRLDASALAPIPKSQPSAELVQLNASVQAIRTDVAGLNGALTNIVKALQADTNAETIRLTAEQEAERKLTEQQIRLGKEKDLEKRIEAKLVSPVQKLVPQVTGIFERVKQALGYLFLGWLTNQSVEALKAQSDGDYQKVNDIKSNILKNVALGIGAIAAMKFGFGAIIRGITGITGKILGLLGKGILKPFQALRNILPGARPAAAAATAAGAGGGMLKSATSFAGKALTVAGGIMDAASGQITDAGLAAGAAFAPGALKIPFAALYGADAISEMFGGNLFGKNPNQPDTQQQSSAAKPPSPTPTIQPQQTMTGAPSTAPPPAPQLPAPQVTPQETMTPATPGTINLDINSLFSSSESAGTDKTQDGSKQDFDQPPLYGTANVPNAAEGKTSTEQAKVTPSVSTPVIQPATLATPPKQQPQVGPLPEPKPEITAINAAQQQQATPPPSQNVKTDVPFIRSSNPDNFWVLYSQVNYNVVM